jgi:predicted dehydrogenase
MKAKNTRTLTAAIIGVGRVGNYHILAQKALGSKVIIFDPIIERAKVAADKHIGVVLANSMEEAIEKADVVHICTPPMYHMEVALASAKYSKPTIIEKPVSFKLDEAIRIYKAAEQSGAPFILATSLRISQAFLEIYSSVRAGDIGTIGSLETTYVHDTKDLESGPTWRKQLEKAAFIYEAGTHAVDLNMWLVDQPVVELQASVSGKKTRDEYRWDEDFAISLKYKDGTLGRIWINASAPLPETGSNIAIYGSEGAYKAHNKYPVIESYKEGDKAWLVRHTKVRPTIELMSAVFNDYLRGNRDNFNPMPDIKDGLKLMIVLYTIEKALSSGRTERVPALEEVITK